MLLSVIIHLHIRKKGNTKINNKTPFALHLKKNAGKHTRITKSEISIMLPQTYLFFLSLVIFGVILLLLIYYVLTLADFECDYLNAQECCTRLNFWVIPKFGIHAILLVLLLLGGHWWLVVWNSPMVFWLGYELTKQPRHSLGVYDPVDIYNRDMLKSHLSNCMMYLAYYFVMFFVMLYYLISSLLEGDPIKRHEDGEIVTKY